ncbi:MAG: hypothetical protein KGL46_08985 [Hyphomicrobiales bacterium]|nr:hypothetical protein [Hyphomicrobiales bacterium]
MKDTVVASTESADVAALKADVARLSQTLADLVKNQTNQASAAFYDASERVSSAASDARDRISSAASDVRDKLADSASDARDRLGAVSGDLEATIERNPLMAVIAALIAGIFVGMMSRGSRR